MAKILRHAPHEHFCIACHNRWQCHVERKEDCQRDDGFECLECVLKSKKLKKEQ
jgi:hypothetical protein